MKIVVSISAFHMHIWGLRRKIAIYSSLLRQKSESICIDLDIAYFQTDLSRRACTIFCNGCFTQCVCVCQYMRCIMEILTTICERFSYVVECQKYPWNTREKNGGLPWIYWRIIKHTNEIKITISEILLQRSLSCKNPLSLHTYRIVCIDAYIFMRTHPYGCSTLYRHFLFRLQPASFVSIGE